MEEKNKEEIKEAKRAHRAKERYERKESKYGKLSGCQIAGICVGGVGTILLIVSLCLHWPVYAPVIGGILMALGIVLLWIR